MIQKTWKNCYHCGCEFLSLKAMSCISCRNVLSKKNKMKNSRMRFTKLEQLNILFDALKAISRTDDGRAQIIAQRALDMVAERIDT